MSAAVRARGDIGQKSLDVPPRDRPGPAAAEKGLDMAFDTTAIGRDGGQLLVAAALGEIEIAEIAEQQVALGRGLLFGRITVVRDVTEQARRFLPRRQYRPRRAAIADGVTPQPAIDTIL